MASWLLSCLEQAEVGFLVKSETLSSSSLGPDQSLFFFFFFFYCNKENTTQIIFWHSILENSVLKPPKDSDMCPPKSKPLNPYTFLSL